MPNYIHRTTKAYTRSIAPADLPEPIGNYIEDPDLSAVEGQPVRYWEISGDSVLLADQATRDAIDAALAESDRDALITRVDDVEDILRAFASVLVDEINILRQQFNVTTSESNQLTDTAFTDRTLAQLRTALRNKLGS